MKITGSERISVCQIRLVIALILVGVAPARMSSAATVLETDYLSRPENRFAVFRLFEVVRSATRFPFTMFPALDGALSANFVEDDLINEDELTHATAFLKGQVEVFRTYSPTLAAQAQQLLDAALFLKDSFEEIADSRDNKGNQAIGKKDLWKQQHDSQSKQASGRKTWIIRQ